jgi:hypothetical protein
LVHGSSGTIVTLPDPLLVSIFTPNSDVIGGFDDGSLVRYCRRGALP